MLAPVLLLALLAAPSVDDAIARLASDDREVWQVAARELSAGDERMVAAVAKAVAAQKIHPSHAQALFQVLKEPKALRALPALLAAPEPELRAAVALALAETRDALAAPSLLAALDREEDFQLRWELARALWQTAPSTESADAIVAAGRRSGSDLRHQLFDLVDAKVLRARITPNERLAFLVEHRLPLRAASVGALDIHLGSSDPTERLADEEDLAFLEEQRKTLTPLLLKALARTPTAWCALLLGHFKEKAALPLLRQAFLEVHDFYGWETSRPCPLDHHQYPLRHALEEAMVHITGGTLRAAIQLSTPEIWSCARRDDGLYLLFRLKPEAALEMAAARFRKTPRDPHECCAPLQLANALAEHLLAPGMSADHLRILLGRAAAPGSDTWRYPIRETDAPLFLELTFSGGKLASAKVVEQVARP